MKIADTSFKEKYRLMNLLNVLTSIQHKIPLSKNLVVSHLLFLRIGFCLQEQNQSGSRRQWFRVVSIFTIVNFEEYYRGLGIQPAQLGSLHLQGKFDLQIYSSVIQMVFNLALHWHCSFQLLVFLSMYDLWLDSRH